MKKFGGIIIAIIATALITLFLYYLVVCLGNNYAADWIKSTTKGEAEGEIHGFLYFMSGVGTILLALIAYFQINKITENSKNQYNAAFSQAVFYIDQAWCNKENTEVRISLWSEYKKAKKEHGCKEAAISRVSKYITSIKDAFDEIPNEKTAKELFKLLNFLELLGTINILKEKKFLNKDDLDTIFGGHLKQYLTFYEEYSKTQNNKPNAQKLLEYMRNDLNWKFKVCDWLCSNDN